MQLLLSLALILLSVLVYPVCLRNSSELQHYWGFAGWDIFTFLRMCLVSGVGIPLLAFLKRKDWPLIIYLILVILSAAFSLYPETSLFGIPNHHEGMLAILGYAGFYLAAREIKDSNALYPTFASVISVIFAVGIIGLIYGNFLDFPIFKMLLPRVTLSYQSWPMYSTLGSPNHLGLFCSLFFPYMLIKKRWLAVAMLLVLLVGCQTRAAWFSVLVTTLFISRKYLGYAALAFLICCIPIHKKVALRIKDTVNAIHFPLRDSDLSGRVYMWSRTIPIAKSTIILGNGPATHPIYFPQYTDRSKRIGFDGLLVDRPHSIYLNIWESTGLLSLVVLMSAIVYKIKKEKDLSLKMACVGFLIAGFFTDSVVSVTPFFATIMGLMGDKNEHT